MGNKQTWFVGVNEAGQADTTQRPVHGPFLFAFGPWPWRTAQKWARAWNAHREEHTLIMCETEIMSEGEGICQGCGTSHPYNQGDCTQPEQTGKHPY